MEYNNLARNMRKEGRELGAGVREERVITEVGEVDTDRE